MSRLIVRAAVVTIAVLVVLWVADRLDLLPHL